MDKQEFLLQLREGLTGLPQEEIEERLTFYREMIEDRMEEGLSEEEAVGAVGTVSEIVTQIKGDALPHKNTKAEEKPKRRLKAWEITLLAIGSPIWLSLGIAAGAIIFSLYIVLWSILIALWAVFGALAGCSVGCIVGGIVFACWDHGLAGAAVIAAGLVCAGLSIFMYYGCKAVTKGVVLLTKKSAIWIKNSFARKEDAK